MKNKIITSILSVIVFFAFTAQTTDPTIKCDQKELKNKCKPLLTPYEYDSAKLTQILLRPKPQKKEIEVPVFLGEKYRLVFTTVGLNKKVIVSIYNKDKDAKKRDVLFTSESLPADQTEFIYEVPKRTFNLYIDYDIPASGSDSIISNGCVAYMLGFKS